MKVACHQDLIRHGLNEWELVAYDWAPDTGIARLTYQHEQLTDAAGAPLVRQVVQVHRAQWISPEERARQAELDRQREEREAKRRQHRRDRVRRAATGRQDRQQLRGAA